MSAYYRPRSVAFVRPGDTPDATIGDGRDEWVMTTGALPGGAGIAAFRAWVGAGVEWRVEGDAYLTADQPRVTFRNVTSGRLVTLYRAAPWFGDEAAPAVCHEAWGHLVGLVGGKGWPLFATPATTGRLQLRADWSDYGEEWPVLGDELQELIRSTSGQGRFELGPAAELGGEELYRYDGRFMYGDLATVELPAGEPRILSRLDAPDELDAVTAYAPARYRVVFTVPTKWRHVGIAGVFDGRRQTFPRRGTHEAWVDGAELRLMRERGWRVQVNRAVVWPGRARPLARWARVVAGWRKLYEPGGRRALVDVDVRGAMRHATRALVLQTIGALHGRPHRVTRVGEADEVPAGDFDVVPVAGGRVAWTELRPRRHPDLSHPEWSAHIWARARVRLYDDPRCGGMWNVPAVQLVGCALDAIYTSAAQDFLDDGRDGTFRLTGKWGRWRPMETMTDLYRAAGEAEGGGDDQA